jgi:hypothetical protein
MIAFIHDLHYALRVPHPFRVFQRNGWDINKVRVYTIS